jgi:hypothetical protein
MDNEWGTICKEAVVVLFKVLSESFCTVSEEKHEKPQGILSFGRDLNLGRHEYGGLNVNFSTGTFDVGLLLRMS